MNASCKTCCKHCPKCEQEAKERREFDAHFSKTNKPEKFREFEWQEYLRSKRG